MKSVWKWFCWGAVSVFSAYQAAAQSADAPGCPAVGTHDVAWVGNRLLQGGKGYAQTPMGQAHYRLVGPSQGKVVLLLHQSPWSMIEFGEIQACLAERGIRSLAVDTPGYGLSDAPKAAPTIEGYADNLVPLLNGLHIGKVVVAGHHSGSTIGAAFAARHPKRTLGLIMQGVPIFTSEEAGKTPGAEPQVFLLNEDGSHLSDYFKLAHDYAGPDPRTKITATWSVIERYQTGVNDIARTLVSHHDMAADLAKVQAPVLILSDAEDFLHEKDLSTAKLFPRFRYQQFSFGTTHALMIDPARWAGVVADFVAVDVNRR